MTDAGQQEGVSLTGGQGALPLARTHGLITARVADELLVYDLKRHFAHRLSCTAALLWTGCNGKRSVTELSALLQPEAHGAVANDVVAYGLRRLDRTHLLEARTESASDAVVCSRRELLRRLTLAGVTVGLPVIASLAVPTALMAQASCLPLGAACQRSLIPCCPGLRCTGAGCK
ncbi:MAG: hypothetical protein NVS4B3_09240 [Gemmatimonadaceae bacterium]